jgi:predicted GNAT family acetyltransferase
MAEEIIDNVQKSRFELHVDGELAALITYGRNKRMIALTHTETEEGFGGKGYATKLIDYAVAEVERDGLELLPFCPFVRSYLLKHPEHLGLVPENKLDNFGLPHPTAASDPA